MNHAVRANLACLAAVACALLAASCRSLERFDADKPAAYCGGVVGAANFSSGFIPSGSPPNLELRLQLDTSSLTDRPGSLSSNDAGRGVCDKLPLFDEAPLRAIPELLHDALSQMEFGDGHEADFFAWVDSTCKGTMLAVVSLLHNGAVEVRLLKPGPDLPPMTTDAADLSGFALFYTTKNEKGCGF
ncbi:MAG TPA: hypothetical protein VGQ57_00605 [Polyangiaceae bacterium]|jgi:hypothetical protein|nr:hypothetical protein [Polyangiaceae bacterium]